MQYGPYLEKYLASICQYSRKEGKIGNLDVPDGANGGDSVRVLAYLRQCRVAQCHWDMLVINCGLHDIKRYNNGECQVSPVEYQQNLIRIFAQAKELGDQLIWIRTTPVINELHNSRMAEFKRFNEDVIKYNELADQVAASHEVWIIDLNSFCYALGGAEIYQDHVHFTSETQKLQAAFIAGQITVFLGSTP